MYGAQKDTIANLFNKKVITLDGENIRMHDPGNGEDFTTVFHRRCQV